MKKICLTLISGCLSLCGFAQISLITPTTSGGFENGFPQSFASNNWATANAATNQWAVGTGSINIGARGAYIGDATNFVGSNTAAVSHFYRSGAGITIPATATNVLFSFRYRQPVVDPTNDSLIVSVGLSTGPLAAPIPLPNTTINSPLYQKVFINTATPSAGYQSVGPIDLSAYAGNSVRIVFTYVNDGAGAIGIPAVDSISVSYCNVAGVTGTPTVCEGLTTNFACATGGGVWSSSNPSVATVGVTGIVTGVASGTATISYSIGTCFSTRDVTVNATPSAITGTLSVCTGNTTTLSNTTAGGVWTSSATGIATVVGATGVVSGVAPGFANISYSLPTGCRSVTTVSVNGVPAVFNVTGGGSYCASGSGVPVGLDNSTGGINYSLSDGVSTVATLAGTGAPLNFGLLTAAGTYTVAAVNAGTGCSSDMAGSAVITVSAPVTPSVSITPPATIVCAGDIGAYTAVPVNGGTTPTYQWYVNGIPGGVGTSYSYLPASGDIISVTLYTGGICALPDTATDSYTALVTPYSSPAITIAVGPSNPSCLGSPVTFAATGTFGGASPIYRWTKNGFNVATGPGYTYVPAAGDVVFCMLTSSYACRTIDTVLSSSITMMVQTPAPAPVINIAATPGTTIILGETVTFTATIVGGSVPVAYQWFINGDAVAGATSSVYATNTLVNADIVSCKVTNMDPCGLSGVKSLLIATGAAGVATGAASANTFSLMPNPNKGAFTIHGATNGAKEVSFKVCNLLGQTVFSKTTTATGVINEPVQLNNLPSGMYILTVSTDAEIQLIHFVVNN